MDREAVDELLDVEYRLSRLEARADAQGVVRTFAVLLLMAGFALIYAGVLKFDLAALNA